VIERTLPFDEDVAAITNVVAGSTKGKVVLRCGEGRSNASMY